MRVAKLAVLIVAAVSLTAFSSDASAASFPTLKPGMRGPSVCAAKWLDSGHRPSVHRRWLHPFVWTGTEPKGKCYFGSKFGKSVKRTKYLLGYPTRRQTAMFGAELDAYMRGTRNRPLSYRVASANRRIAALKLKSLGTTGAKLDAAVSLAKYLITQKSRVHYTQRFANVFYPGVVSRMSIVKGRLKLPPLNFSIYEDCSSSTTGIYWRSGLPDPNGRGYDGYGYTGTQASHGRQVWKRGQSLSLLKPGDLVLYGGFPYKHVTMYLGAGRVFSHGSEYGPYNLPVLYRSDASVARRYVG